MMKETEKIGPLLQAFHKECNAAASPGEWNDVRVKYLGRKSVIMEMMKLLKTLSPEDKKILGKEVNKAKAEMERALEDKKRAVESCKGQIAVDWTLPARGVLPAKVHPLTTVRRQMEDIFIRMGFDIRQGPDMETEWHCFDALNIPETHPARDEQDTFYLNREKMVLRTHTSPVQIRTMLEEKPPIYMIAPGRVYRNDVPDASHSPVFHQVEALAVDENITFGDLKGVIYAFLSELFGSGVKTRFDNSFFPFTEPSAEVYMSCFCGGKGCSVCKGSGWLEIGGAGMVDPEVFRAVGIDPEKYTGFAFGFGLERMAMLMYGVPDIRYFYENDLRMLTTM